MRSSDTLRSWLPAIGVAVPLIVLPVAILSLPLAGAERIHLPASALTSWNIALYGIPNILGMFLSWRNRMPLLMTGNVFVIIFVTSVDTAIPFAEIVGAAVVAGVAVTVLTALGLVGRMAAIIPPPVVLGLLAGAVLPFVADVFTMLSDEPVMIGATLLAFLWGSRWLDSRLPPILPALIAGFIVAGITGKLGELPGDVPTPLPEFVMPAFSISTIVTVTPVLVILMTLQSNVPSMVFLRTQGYHPPERELNHITGAGSALASLLGPTGISLSLPATSIVAGPDAGDPTLRYRSVYISGAAMLVLTALSGAAAELPAIVPLELLLALAGLAVVGILGHALREIATGPVRLGPILALCIAVSEISMLGLGPFFWAIAIGTTVSHVFERRQPGP